MKNSSAIELFDAEGVPRTVSVLEWEHVSEGFEGAKHRHRKAQLIVGITGMITCEIERGLWMVPPQCAVWIPGGTDHSIRGIGDLDLYILFVDPELVPELPKECCSISVSPLLRELVIEMARLPMLYDCSGPAGRLVHTMLDQLAVAPIERLHLPLPSDPRLRRIADAIIADPSDRATISQWARRVGVSERSLSRLVPQETGMSFVRWRQQFQVTLALDRLSQGEAVQAIAFDLGYESASAFITMFRKVLGKPPAKYLAARKMTLQQAQLCEQTAEDEPWKRHAMPATIAQRFRLPSDEVH